MALAPYDLLASNRPQYVPYAIPVTQGGITQLDLGQPCWAVIVRNASPFTIYVKNGVGISSILDPLALPVSPNSYGVVSMSGAKNVAIRVDTPKTTGATFQSPSITATLSSVPVEPRETTLSGATVTQLSKSISGVVPQTIWTPVAGNIIRVYGVVFSSNTAGEHDIAEQTSVGGAVQTLGAIGFLAGGGISPWMTFLPYGFKLKAANNILVITGPGGAAITAMATGDEE